MPDILVIDDMPEILSANTSHFSALGYNVTAVDNGAEAIARLNEKQFDCIVLDILMPEIDGYAVCQAARSLTDTPIIFLSCLDQIDDKIKGLMTGGDDYMTKPYSLDELAARVHALIRRGGMARTQKDAEFTIDRHSRIIHAGGKNVLLSQKEYELFMLLYENPMKVFTKEEIVKRIWKENAADSSAVAVNVMRLRRKLDFAARHIGVIDNEYGTGYRLIPPETEGPV